MALLDPTFFLGVLVLLYLLSFVLFAVVRITTGLSIQRIGYFSLRRIAYSPRDGVRIEIRGLGLNLHRPTFAQPTWLSIVVDELSVSLDLAELEKARARAIAAEDGLDSDSDVPTPAPVRPTTPKTTPKIQRDAAPEERSKTWERLTNIKERLKRIHRKVNWLRMVDLVATNSTVALAGVGSLQMGSFTIAIDTRRKTVDRARFFLQGRARKLREAQQAEWIVTLRSVLFTADGREPLEIIDSATLNIHGYLYEALDGLRDAAIALKIGRLHIPYDDVLHSLSQYRKIRPRPSQQSVELGPAEHVTIDRIIQEVDAPGSSTNHALMQTVSDSKEFVSSILRGIKEVQFAISFIGFTKKIESVKPAGSPVLLTASMKEVGIDLHRLDPKSPAHRMYFTSNDIAHEALAAALSISVGLDDGHGKPERIMYIPMATTTARTTLPSKTVELANEGTAEQRNANILFANSVVTSPSVDLDPRHLPLLMAMLQRKPRPPKAQQHEQKHMLISRLLPKANIKFSMHEPVLRITLPPVQPSSDSEDFDLIISSISSVSLDMESFHSAVEELHYSLAATMRLQTHNLYYQTCTGTRFDLLQTESFDLKVQLSASPNLHVVASGNLQTFTVKMIQAEIRNGLRQIVQQMRPNVVEPDKHPFTPPAPKQSNFLRGLPSWLLHFHLQCSDCSFEVAGVDKDISEEQRGVAVQLESWSADYQAQRFDGLQRRPSHSRRRASSRGMMSPESDLLAAYSGSSPKKKYHHEGDGRRLTFMVRGLEAFMIESSEKWEFEPFISIPKLDVTLATLSDNQGPLFHVYTYLRSLLVQYSLYRHYAVGVAIATLQNAFLRRRKPTVDLMTPPTSPTSPLSPQRRIVGHLSPPSSGNYPSPSDIESWRAVPELVTVDFRSTLIQIKAEMPSDPPMMFHVYNLEAGRHRWAPPFLQAKLVRLYAEAPRMRRVWAKLVSVKNLRADYRESRHRYAGGGVREERMFDVVTETIRLAVPHDLIIYKVTDNFVNTFKSVQQLHHRFKTGTNEYILDKGPEPPKKVPKVSLRAKNLLFELEDGAFEWKLGVIYRTGLVEMMQRQAREEAFRLKVKKIHEEEAKRGSTKSRARSTAPHGESSMPGDPHVRSRSADGRRRSFSTIYMRGRIPRYDPEAGAHGLSGKARISIAEARHQLDLHNAKSWKQRIDRAYEMSKAAAKEHYAQFWGINEIPDDLEDSEKILEVPQRPALMSTLINDLHIVIDKPSFPLKELPDFLHKVGKGMPKDMKYTLLIPMNLQVNMGEARISLRDYPLPFLHVPATKSEQSARLPALALSTDFVIAEEYRGLESTRKIRVPIIPPRDLDGLSPSEGGFAIEVRRTIGPVKTFSDMNVDIHTANPTRITWGPSYQPAIQDMMMAIESMTKPQLDPSEKVGFWDKIRLNFHSRIRVAWRGDGDVHLALKGSRDPYQVTGNGAGFLMCWRGDVRWNIWTEDDPKRFMTVDSGEYVLAVPDYSQQVREVRRQRGEDESIASNDSFRSGAAFKKVVMKLSGKVQWLAGLVFERAIENGTRSFEFKPHYEIVLKNPEYARPQQDGLPYDAFRGFRSQHIHLSLAVLAPADRDWTGSNSEPSRSYNTAHLTPRLFTHFFSWWSLFSGPLSSLPIRQGTLWPGREKNSKKFGRHLATIKYNVCLAPLFLSHIYKHKDAEDYSENSISATGIKVRFDSAILDLHQRREEFNTRDRGRKTQVRTTGMKIHAGQLDLVSADVRAISASIRGTTADAVMRQSLSTFITDQEGDGTDLSRFTIPDNDLTWIDMDDFVELDWILPTEPNPDTKILPLAFAPRVTYFRQTDINGIIDGDPDRTSPFGQEPTHFCVMSHDDDPRIVQSQLIRRRLEQLEEQMAAHDRTLGEIDLRIARGEEDLRAESELLSHHTSVLKDKKTFLESMLTELRVGSGSCNNDAASCSSAGLNGSSSSSFRGSLETSAVAEFASDFKNRFVVHNLQLKWNNTLRNIILRYIHQVGQRRGFVYYMSRPAVKFILDLVEEQQQAKSNAIKNGGSSVASGTGSTLDGSGSNQDAEKDLEDRIRRILQDSRKFVAPDDDDVVANNPAMVDLSAGIADEFTTQNSYHVRLIAPQIQLQSDKNKKHVVLCASKGMELKVVDVLDKSRMFDEVSGLVQRRFLVNMDSTQFFVTHQKWFSTQLVSMYSGNTYGAPVGSAWPPWVPMEVMFDFESDPFGFKRVVQKTSAMLRYDKFNTLRLKYNDEINTSENGGVPLLDSDESRTDNLWVIFPKAHAMCNSQQYYAIYIIVLDLLMYSEPLEKTRNERLEKIMLASDFSDLRGAPEMVIKLQERVRQLEEIKTHFQVHSKNLDKKGWKDRLVLERDLAACEDELFFLMKAITTSQRKYDNRTSSAMLKWSIMAKEIVWRLLRDNNEPLVELQLKNVEYNRVDNSDGSHINLVQVGKILGFNLLDNAIYPAMIAPYTDDMTAFDTGSQPMIRVYWNMLEAIAGIPVMDHFEVNLYPLKVQLEREVGKKLFEYIFPGTDGGKVPGKNESPLIIKHSPSGDEETEADDDSLAESVHYLQDHDDDAFSTRAGSLELRLRPTLTSDPDETSLKQQALSVHSGEGTSFRLLRVGTGFKAAISKKRSFDSLRMSTSQPGVGRSATSTSIKDAVSIASESKKGSRFILRHRTTDLDKPKQSDDLSMMMDRASNYMTFAYIKMPSVVLCLSYKGKGERNFEDVHDFVFRLPTIEWRNKTWSNLDLALALKSRVIKALISHTGAIIGNKFSKHRPNTTQQSKMRELASNSVLLATPTSSEAREASGDDSSSIYGPSPVDFSRSPPQSIRRSHTTSVPVPSSSRSSSVASSMRSQQSITQYPAQQQQQSQQHTAHVSVTSQATGAIPSFLMAPSLTGSPESGTSSNNNNRSSGGNGSGFSLLRPTSSGWSRAFGGGRQQHQQESSGEGLFFSSRSRPSSRPGSSSGVPVLSSSPRQIGYLSDDEGFGGNRSADRMQRRRGTSDSAGGTGPGGGLRERFHAFTSRLIDREGSVIRTSNNVGADVPGGEEETEEGDQQSLGLVRRLSRRRG